MCTVNPSRISKTFNEAALREVVKIIVGRHTDALLEIVNYNVDLCVSLLVTLRKLNRSFPGITIRRAGQPFGR